MLPFYFRQPNIEISPRLIPDGTYDEQGLCFFMLARPSDQRIEYTIRNTSTNHVRFDGYTHICRSSIVDVELMDEQQINNGGTLVMLEPGGKNDAVHKTEGG